jgi:hypothetical protein
MPYIYTMTKRTQKQRQSQKQVVNIRLDAPKRKRSRRQRRRRMPTLAEAVASDYLQPQQLAPTIILQTGQGAPIGGTSAIPNTRIPAFSQMLMGSRTPALEDIGQIGTEGRVEIMDRPTKQEQLGELIEPVSQVPTYGPSQFQFTNPQAPNDPSIGLQFGEPIRYISPASEQPIEEVSVSAEPFFKTGSKGYYIQKIKELSGKELNPNESTLKELKYAYKILKSGKQK